VTVSSGETSSHVLESPRRLAAIVAADIAGYSRLMGIDEEGTHARVKRHRREIIEPTIAEHHGRLIKYTGDGFFAMFESPLEAVRCAIVIQQSMVGRNASLPRPQWVQFRIGVNLGDVIVDSDEIYGDGVNIAARLETLAVPGEVFISGGVYEQIKNKLVCGYQSLGDEKLKNITDPVRVYRVLPDPAAVARAKRVKWAAVAGACLAALAGVASTYWYFWHPIDAAPTATVASVAPQAGTTQPAASVTAPAAIPVPPVSEPSRVEATGSSSPPVLRVDPPTPPVARAEPPAPPATRVEPAAPPRAEPRPAAPPPPPAAAALPQQLAVAEPPRLVSKRPPQAGPYASFRDCTQCPEMIALPGGSFAMGSSDDPSEKPVRQMSVAAFAIGRFPVTVGEWKECVRAASCSYVPQAAEDDAPVTNVSWNDAQQYVGWLSKAAQRPYRLPSEAEWEYAARGGTSTKFWWGAQLVSGVASCKGCGDPHDMSRPAAVGSYKPNPFGLYDMAGSVAQWVADCWHKDYQGAPKDAASWATPDCRQRVLRGGSWRNDPNYLRSASREFYDSGVRYLTHGLRVARSQ
jgi:formylglycine-generating enzyme required for sulfatase activity/class 3 adenylate cyclase